MNFQLTFAVQFSQFNEAQVGQISEKISTTGEGGGLLQGTYLAMSCVISSKSVRL